MSVPAPPPRADVDAPPASAPGPNEARRWPAWSLAGWLTGFVVGQIALASGLAATGHSTRELVDGRLPLTFDLLGTAGLWVGFVGVPWLVTRPPVGRGLAAAVGLRARAVDGFGAIAGVVCQFALVPAISLPWVLLFGRDLDELDDPARELTSRAGSTTTRVLLVLVVVIGAPIAEEIFFRGFVQRGLVAWVPVPVAIAGSSLLFALTHFQFLQFPALAAFGAVLGVLAHRSGRLGPSIATHMGFNAVTVALLLTAS